MRKTSPHPDDRIDLSQALTDVISEIAISARSFSHVDVARTLVCVGSNRRGNGGGIYGKLIPLKFRGGSPVQQYRGRTYAIPEITKNGSPCLYLIYFYMPRFFDLPWDEKLRVIFHELYHISPDFDGDIRRMGAVKTAHGHSKKHFDSLYAAELNECATGLSETPHRSFLEMNTRELYRRYRRVTAVRMKHPRPVAING